MIEARSGGLPGVGSSPVGVIPTEDRRSGADDPVWSWPLPPVHRQTLVLDEHRYSVVRSRDNVPQFLS
jgi:hypothetical protein